MTSREYEACCKVLGVRAGASDTEIKAAYRDLVKVWHPDRFPNDPRLRAKAQAELKRINEAFEFLRTSRPVGASPRRRSERPSEPRPDRSASTPPRSHSPPGPAAPARPTRRVPRWALVLLVIAAVTGLAGLGLYVSSEGGDESQPPAAVSSAPIRLNPTTMSNLPQEPAASSATFTRGSHKDDVLRIQGTPSNITTNEALGQDVWFYGSSTVTISTSTGKVQGWSNRGNLKVLAE